MVESLIYTVVRVRIFGDKPLSMLETLTMLVKFTFLFFEMIVNDFFELQLHFFPDNWLFAVRFFDFEVNEDIFTLPHCFYGILLTWLIILRQVGLNVLKVISIFYCLSFGMPHLDTFIFLSFIVKWTKSGWRNRSWHSFDTDSILHFGWDEIWTHHLSIVSWVCYLPTRPDCHPHLINIIT